MVRIGGYRGCARRRSEVVWKYHFGKVTGWQQPGSVGSGVARCAATSREFCETIAGNGPGLQTIGLLSSEAALRL